MDFRGGGREKVWGFRGVERRVGEVSRRRVWGGFGRILSVVWCIVNGS